MLVFEAYFGVLSIVGFSIQVILIAGVSTFLTYLISHRTISFREVFLRNALFFTALLGFLTVLFLGFITYQNMVPGKLSDIVLTRSGQTVHFLQMSHIADVSFYEEKRQKIESFEKDGFVFLVEGVRPGTPESQKQFDAKMGFRFTESLYQNISEMIGLSFQDNRTLFAGVQSGSLISVDISLDDIVDQFSSGVVSGESSPILDIEKELASLSGTIKPQEKKFMQYVTRGVLNFTIKMDSASLFDLSFPPELMSAILADRDQAVVDYISQNSDQNIVVVYGALHFPGVLEGLRKLDPTWKIESFTASYPYTAR